MNEIQLTTADIGGESVQTVDARTLHAFLGVGRDFTSWIKARISQYGFSEGDDYLLTKTGEQLPSGTKYRTDYQITVDMAKELAMVERTPKGREVRRYFIECERRARAASVPSITQEVLDRIMAFERQDKLTFGLAQFGSRQMLARKEALKTLREERDLLQEITQLRLFLGSD